MVPDPWEALSRTDLVLTHVDMPERGRYYDRQRVIMLRKGMLLVEQRATLWHELVHAERRDRCCQIGWLDDKQERAVDRRAARLAIPINALVAAMCGARSYVEVADALKTTCHLLRVRIDSMHPAERGYLRQCSSLSDEGVA